jgi:hypothetical protein
MIKRRGRNQIENLTPDHKSLQRRGQMKFDWSMLCNVGNIYIALILWKGIWFKKDISVQSFRTLWILVLGLPFGSFRGKWHLDVVRVKRHIIYYREGNDAFSQKVVSRVKLMLEVIAIKFITLLSTCTYRPLFLVVHVDIWRTPKSLVSPKLGLSHSSCEKVGTRGTLPTSSTRGGEKGMLKTPGLD